MNTKEEIISRLEELLDSERNAAKMDNEIVEGLINEKMKSFFENLQMEEENHAKAVENLIEILRSS